MKELAWTASDYAGMRAGPWDFYYGYEYCLIIGNELDQWEPDPWGFVAKKDGKIVCHFEHESSGRGTDYDLLTCIGIMIEKKYA